MNGRTLTFGSFEVYLQVLQMSPQRPRFDILVFDRECLGNVRFSTGEVLLKDLGLRQSDLHLTVFARVGQELVCKRFLGPLIRARELPDDRSRRRSLTVAIL